MTKRLQIRSTTYTCAMHPKVKENKPGRCPKCEMLLIPKTFKKLTR